MFILTSILLGIIQGITEFLPISSSAHLIIVSWFIDGQSLPLSLNVGLHLGTLIAILIYFQADFLSIAKSFFVKDNLHLPAISEKRRFLPLLIIASLPAAFVGFTLKDVIEEFLHHPSATIVPLIGVGWALWYFDRKSPVLRTANQLSWLQGLLLGMFQALALIPGVSRSGATILGGRLCGLDRIEAARFSFLMGAPVMVGAVLLEAKNLQLAFHSPELVAGMLAAFLSGLATIHFLLKFLQKSNFLAFFIYRSLLAMVLLSQIL
ncbi:MAG: undecaprenyl-diphosphate phosphatase [Oligoflexales bacterium]|nr:undecaprenyl-diphosphate phosphatase [Oligoflexales bacterium]